MRHEITIYRSDRSIWALPIRPDDAPGFSASPIFVARPDDMPVFAFSVYEFAPRPFASSEGASFRKLRMASVPIVVASSLPVVLVGEGRKARLSVWWSPKGIDAEAVHHVARMGEKGLKILGYDTAIAGNPDGRAMQRRDPLGSCPTGHPLNRWPGPHLEDDESLSRRLKGSQA